MTRFTIFIAALALAVSVTSAIAQPAISELGAFEAEYPNRDPLNGGALTPAGRLGLELPDGAAQVDDSYAAIGASSPLRAQRHPSQLPATDAAAPNAGPAASKIVELSRICLRVIPTHARDRCRPISSGSRRMPEAGGERC
jgi:hypothetical protein